MIVRINNSRKFYVTSLLRVFGFETDESIKTFFSDILEDDDFDYIGHTLAKDKIVTSDDAAVQIYSKMRPGEMIDPDSAKDYIKSIFLNPERLYLGNVARRKINAKLSMEKDLDKPESHLFDADDMIAAMRYLVSLANNKR